MDFKLSVGVDTTGILLGPIPYTELHMNISWQSFNIEPRLMLLFIGIHNAWDAVTYHVFAKKPKHEESLSRSHRIEAKRMSCHGALTAAESNSTVPK